MDNVDARDEEFVQLSVQLAHEYVKLGKLRDAGVVYKRSLGSSHIQTASTQTRVVLLLRHAESLIKIGDVNQGYLDCFHHHHVLTLQPALNYIQKLYKCRKACL